MNGKLLLKPFNEIIFFRLIKISVKNCDNIIVANITNFLFDINYSTYDLICGVTWTYSA